MIRLFNVYYPVRTLVLLVVEALIVGSSFLLATWWLNQETSWILLNVEGGYLKIVCVTAIVLLLSHGFDLYDSSSMGAKWDQIFRLFWCWAWWHFLWLQLTSPTAISCRAASFSQGLSGACWFWR